MQGRTLAAGISEAGRLGNPASNFIFLESVVSVLDPKHPLLNAAAFFLPKQKGERRWLTSSSATPTKILHEYNRSLRHSEKRAGRSFGIEKFRQVKPGSK
jgi:hypothetical protein